MENPDKKRDPSQTTTTTSELDSAYSSGAQRSQTESSGTYATRSQAGSSGATSRATRSQGDSSGRGGRRSQTSNDGRDVWGVAPSFVSASHTSVPSSTSISCTTTSTSQTSSSKASTRKAAQHQVDQEPQAASSSGKVGSPSNWQKSKAQPFKKKKLELTREAAAEQHPAEQELSKRLDEGRFCVAVSLVDGQVRQTSDSLTADLGFPGDMWIGRNILDFVHVDDRDTFTTRVTENIHLEMVEGEKHTFAVRVRQYNGLGKGFVVRTSFKPFLLSTFFRGLGNAPEKSDQLGKYVFIVAEPIHCAYSKPLAVGPLLNCLHGKSHFWTQHKADYSLSWLDPTAVSFTGFLNQHIIGQSIFKSIHPHDLGTVAETFANLCQSRQACHSKGVRMRARNGSYITVESTWTTFINPWTQKLEFVMGRHEVVLGPQCLDNFFGGNSKWTGNQHREVVAKPTKESPRERKEHFTESKRMDLVMDEMLKQTKSLKDNLKHRVFLPHQNFFGSSSDSPSYETLNYRASISRFLNSQPSSSWQEERSIPRETSPDEKAKALTTITEGALAQHDSEMAAMLKLQYNQERNKDSYRARYPHGNMEAFSKIISDHSSPATSLARSRDVSTKSTRVDPEKVSPNTEESDSSDLYTFLQTSSDVGQDPPRSGRGAGVKRKLDCGWTVNRTEPFWNQRVDLTTKLLKQYQLPHVDCEETMQRDQEKLAEMLQPQEVEEQLEQLIEDIKGDGLKLEEFMEDLRSSPSEPELSTESETENSEEKTAAELRKMIWKQNYLLSMSIILEEDAPFPEPTSDSLAKEVEPAGGTQAMPPTSGSSNASDL